MSASKRKQDGGNGQALSSNKRRKADAPAKARTTNDISDSSEQTKPLTSNPKPKTVLTKEQPAFPRGGGELLTPLERKQIQAKANRDAVLEQNRGADLFSSKRILSDDSDLENDSNPVTDDGTKLQKKKSEKTKKKKTKSVEKTETLAIEGLSYKRLAVGSQILGRVASINSTDLTVALPNNLVGFVPLHEISSQFTQKLQKLLEKKDGQEDEEEDEGEDDVDELETSLQSHFEVGQFLRTSVITLGGESGGKKTSKKHIELTLDPQKTNAGLTRSDLQAGITVQAAITSIEDHGLVVDLGIEDAEQISGFIPAKALGKHRSLSTFRIGSVMLCHVTSSSSSGNIIKLSPNFEGTAPIKHAANVAAFLPGTLTEILLTEVTSEGLAGKIMGMVDATADVVHSGSFKDREALSEQFKIGQKVKGRLLFTMPLSGNAKLGFSVHADMVSIGSTPSVGETDPTGLISSTFSKAHVIRVVSGLGVYLSLSKGKFGFAHISRLSDKKVDSVSETIGPFKLGSEHPVRVLDYNSVDGLYIVSLQQTILQQPYLRIEDVPVAEVVKTTVEKILIGPNGVSGVLVKLTDGITGLVPQIHLSDVTLSHPERKFREGATVSARVLSVDKRKRQIRLTTKKTLVNSDQQLWSRFEDISVGETSVGTLIKVDSHGAIMQFFGDVKGFLPVSEMSEAYIKDAKEHFKTGQVLTVNAISVNASERRLTISCRDRNPALESNVSSVKPGTVVSGTVFEKSQDDLLLRLNGSEAIARLTLDHVSDGSEKKRRSALDKIRVGQKLENLLVLEVQRRSHLVSLSNRSTLLRALEERRFLTSFEDLKQDATYTGIVSNITEDGVFVRYANGISGLIPKQQVPSDQEDMSDFGMQLLQAVTARVIAIDHRGATPRFWLSMREATAQKPKPQTAASKDQNLLVQLANPVDDLLSTVGDLSVGRVTKARITSVKDTQINVELAKDVHGRIDVSEVFDAWDDIKDRKRPLRNFAPKQIIEVRILGAHDSRNHRFLPLSHRHGKNTVFELSAKPSTVKAVEFNPLTMLDMSPNSSWLAYVNNIVDDHLMVNIGPAVRGRIRAIDVSDDLNLASDLTANFPLGSALRVKVIAVDQDKGHLDLTGRSSVSTKSLELSDLHPAMILPGRVTRVTDRSILVQLSENLVGAVDLIDMSDDYSQANPASFQKNDIVRVSVLKVDASNKKVSFSTRPSKILSSSLEVTDREIASVEQLKVNDVIRGFVSNVSDKGVFIVLGHNITGFVRVTNLSDLFLKNWKEHFQRDQLLTAKVIAVDPSSGHIELSLKKSLLDSNYKPPRTFASTAVGDIVSGKVVKVESFGVFILADNSENVRGLCHRSEIAETKIEDASKLFSEGDKVKAKVLKIDLPNRRINFGMKASYFSSADDGSDSEGDLSDKDSDAGVALQTGLDSNHEDDGNIAVTAESDDSANEEKIEYHKRMTGLSVGGFDWYGMPSQTTTLKRNSEDNVDESAEPKQKKKRKAEIQIDRTGDLDANGPQSSDDFERLLLGEPDSSLLWLQYMAFYIESEDINSARQIGERALKTMGLGQDVEKMNIWIALLNLENSFGDDDAIEATFKRACEYNDPQEIYSRLISIYIQSGKQSKADDLFQEMLKKFTQDPKIYINYANFLFDTVNDADRGRAVLSRALQVLPPSTHFDITSKFAQMEFKSSVGLPERGRTIFEGLINSFPKRIDLFNVMLDMELSHGKKDESDEMDEQVRRLFERIFARQLKPKQAKHFFKRWLAFEEELGDVRKIEEVKAKAATWVKQSAEKE